MLATGEPPVSGSTVEQIIANIKAGRINYALLNQKKLSSRLVELILRLLNPEDTRISIREVLSHPWMTMQLEDRRLNINFEKIRNYSKFSKVVARLLSSRCWC